MAILATFILNSEPSWAKSLISGHPHFVGKCEIFAPCSFSYRIPLPDLPAYMVSSSSVFGGWWCDGGSFQKGVRVRNCFLLGLIWPPGPICTWCEQDLLKCQVHITLMVAMIYELAIRESPIFSSIHLNQVQYTSSSNISWAVIIIFTK